jgi:PUA domain protein
MLNSRPATGLAVRRVRLSNKDVKRLREQCTALAPVLEGAGAVDEIQLSEREFLYLIDGEPLLLRTSRRDAGNYVLPTLYLVHKSERRRLLPPYPMAVVDAGAAVRIVNGADVMRPGIKHIAGEFGSRAVVLVTDERARTIAVTLSLYSSAEILQMQRGKVLLNMHHLGDRVWRACLELVKK